MQATLATTDEATATYEKATAYEEERGKPMPSKNHAIVQSRLIVAFSPYQEQFTTLSELSLELDGQPLVPDISLFPTLPVNWRHDEVKLTDPPVLVVEILSTTQAVDDLVKKAETYFAAGVQSCWIVQPSLELIAVLNPTGKTDFYSTGTVVDPATKIEIAVADVFR